MRALRRSLSLALALSALLTQHRADAACNRPDLEFALPPDGAEGVPPNAKLFARYALNAEYAGEEIMFAKDGGEPGALTGSWSASETLLNVAPGLEPGARYEIEWPRLRGINSANLGRGSGPLAFQVGTVEDQHPPVFSGLSAVDWDVDRERDDCTDGVEDRYVFDFELAEANDDGGRESLMVLLFQTRGPNVKSDAPEPVSLARLPADGRLRLERTLADGEGDVCFAAVARDLTGKVSASGAKEVCVETVAPPFFEGCRAAPAPARGWGELAAALLAWGLWRRRSSR